MLDLSGYKSASQRARVFSETWVAENLQCPHCLGSLERTRNNTVGKDFVCGECQQSFELKSKRGLFGAKVVDGAYATMIASVRSDRCPNLLLLSYSVDFQVQELVAVPSRFLVEEIVVPRKALGPHCRRAGWQGCNLNVGLLPPDGRIACVKDFSPLAPEEIMAAWNRTAFLDDVGRAARGWLALTMSLVRQLRRDRFALADLYALESQARNVFPGNANVRPKLRQQLQRLRDLGWLEFEKRGNYRLL